MFQINSRFPDDNFYQSREYARMRGICKLKLKNKAVEGSKEVERKEGNAFEKSDIQCAFKSELRYAKEKF